MSYIKDLVSVVIPTYKRNDMLPRAIESVLHQSYNDIEILVVNDNERQDDDYSKKLYEIINNRNDPRIRLIQQEKHINGAAARNAGIREAKGEYISFLDDDDYWELSKVETQVKVLKSLDETWGAVTCLNILRKGDQVISADIPYSDGNILIAILERRIGIGMGAALFRRSALDQSGYFDELLTRHQDLQLFAQVSSRYKIRLVKQYLYNIDTSDSKNRPTPEKLQRVKKEYYSSITNILQGLTEGQRKIIFALNNFEIAYAYLKSGNRKESFILASEVLKSPKACYLSLERCIRKYCARRFKNRLLSKYGYTKQKQGFNNVYNHNGRIPQD